MEHLLHCVWKHKIFPLHELQTTTGLPVEVIDTGLPNPNAGPDFFSAKLKIDGTPWVGNVEIHAVSPGWFHHGHDHDIVYDSVTLHIATEIDCEIYRTNGEPVPQLRLACPRRVKEHYDELCRADVHPPCYSILETLSKLTTHSWLAASQTGRFDQKNQTISRRLQRCNQHWEDAFFITPVRNFGFGLNGDASEAQANLLPFRSIDKHCDGLTRVGAFFFGQAGSLEGEPVDDYFSWTQKEFRYLQHKSELPPVMNTSLWHFLRLRPSNFPYVRLAQLASLYYKERSPLSRVMEAQTLKELKSIFSGHTSAYREEYFMSGKTSPREEKSIGSDARELTIINTIISFLYAYGLHKADERLYERAASLLEELKAENNYATRVWNEVGIPVRTVADSQALLQLQKEYCDKKRYLYRRFEYEYLKHK